MDATLTTREAAERLGVTVRSFHWLATKHRLDPARSLPGIRGAKFWKRSDIDRLGAKLRKEAA